MIRLAWVRGGKNERPPTGRRDDGTGCLAIPTIQNGLSDSVKLDSEVARDGIINKSKFWT